jgi:hypothetical protein
MFAFRPVLAVLLVAAVLTTPAWAARNTPAAATPANVSPHPMFVENQSPADLPTTVAALLEETRAAGWSHLDTVNARRTRTRPCAGAAAAFQPRSLNSSRPISMRRISLVPAPMA